MDNLTTIILSIIGVFTAIFSSQGFWTWRSEKKNRSSEIIEKVDELSKELTEHISQSEERSALEARRRILRFNDELLNHVMHSKEYFDEIVSDIDIYERYCREHPNFPNNKTVMSIEHIKECYKKCEKEDSFL